MADLTAQNAYSELIAFLFFVDGPGDPAVRQGMLTDAHLADLLPLLTLYGPGQAFCSGLVKALADRGQPALVAFLDALSHNAFVDLGVDDRPRLQNLKAAVAGLSLADWQACFLGKVRTYLFMADDLPPEFVPRPLELDDIRSLLLETDPGGTGPDGSPIKRPQPGTVGLHGFGGYGKTTLALAACHDEEVRQACFPDGILWTVLGRNLTETDVKARMSEWVQRLGGPDVRAASLPSAKDSLRQALADRQMLLVIDDVWSEADLNPFLQGGARCVRLVTTRDIGTLPPDARLFDVGQMAIKDAQELLSTGLPPGYDAALADLSERLGGWSILLRLAKARLRQRVLQEKQPMGQALADILEQLKNRGLTAFDPDKAVTATVNLSMEVLEDAERQRYAELGVFPEDVPIPSDVIARLWKRTGSLSKSDAEDLCSRLLRLSLLLSFDRGAGTIQLHDVLADYARHKLPDPAQVHLTLVDLWGERPRPQDAYAWRWVAYHLSQAAQASRQPQKHELAERVVKLTGAPDFQTGHKAAVKDLLALQSAVGWSVQASAADDSPEGLVTLVKAARQMVAFRRKELRPEPLFELAAAGRIEEAERQTALFDLDQNWRHALLLTFAWLGAEKNKPKAVETRNRVDREMTRGKVQRPLLKWVDVDLLGKPAPTFKYDEDPPERLIRNILNRIGGGQVDRELLGAYGLDTGSARDIDTPPGPEEMLAGKSSPAGEKRSTAFLVDKDGPYLIAYAARHEGEGAAAFDEYLSAFTNYNYPEYRFRSLWILLRYVVQHPNKDWVQKTVQKVFVSALGGASVEFEDALPATILALQAHAGDAAMTDFLGQRVADLCTAAEGMTGSTGGDSWGFHKRHMLALAQAFGCLQLNVDKIDKLLKTTEAIQSSGFAGYQAPVHLAFADTARICQPEDTALVERALGYAQTRAHSIQDYTFCARVTARVIAMRSDWYGNLDLDEMAEGLRETPQARDFAAAYDVGHDYTGRGEHLLRLPIWVTNAATLASLARVFNRPVDAFASLNREQSWTASTVLDKGVCVRVPDPGFAPHLAARLAAEALASAELDPDERIELIRSLVPTALASPTALDAVLARLSLAWGMGYPDKITLPLIAALRQEAPLTDARTPVPPIGEFIG